ncbi:uncharacterized protein F4822DRAFT_409191 [Hypoxylon trugodes]|uniref:uncharacterized protein n=1 Tax=Hypoxylon trugodes TaxID=326681 RepID=UPI00219938C5|nr:uncharacterized protein F4822DRAFT_409191 [Hypoxylon trugodes]KAI1386189.1 hypothetical protein F4822DRAFT_409191 [Hypoxylon trugodes]
MCGSALLSASSSSSVGFNPYRVSTRSLSCSPMKPQASMPRPTPKRARGDRLRKDCNNDMPVHPYVCGVSYSFLFLFTDPIVAIYRVRERREINEQSLQERIDNVSWRCCMIWRRKAVRLFFFSLISSHLFPPLLSFFFLLYCTV